MFSSFSIDRPLTRPTSKCRISLACLATPLAAGACAADGRAFRSIVPAGDRLCAGLFKPLHLSGSARYLQKHRPQLWATIMHRARLFPVPLLSCNPVEEITNRGPVELHRQPVSSCCCLYGVASERGQQGGRGGDMLCGRGDNVHPEQHTEQHGRASVSELSELTCTLQLRSKIWAIFPSQGRAATTVQVSGRSGHDPAPSKGAPRRRGRLLHRRQWPGARCGLTALYKTDLLWAPWYPPGKPCTSSKQNRIKIAIHDIISCRRGRWGRLVGGAGD